MAMTKRNFQVRIEIVNEGRRPTQHTLNITNMIESHIFNRLNRHTAQMQEWRIVAFWGDTSHDGGTDDPITDEET